jgi:lipopolysaccharide export LptBFGC system permease protein LptF
MRFDRYVLRSFLAHLVVVAAAFLGLFTALDLVGHSDEIGQTGDEGAVGLLAPLARYYLINLAFLLYQFAPYIVLLAAVGTVLALLRNREWTPMLAAGHSALRAFLPIFAVTAVLAGGLSWLKEDLLPSLRWEHEVLTSRLFHQEELIPHDLWVRGTGDARMHAERWIADDLRVRGFEVFALDEDGSDERVVARAATWRDGAWQLREGMMLDAEGERPLATFARAGLDPPALERAFFARHRPLDLSGADFSALLAGDPDHRQAATLAWTVRTAPLVPLVLLLLGLPFVLGFERRSSFEGLAQAFLFCALFFVADLLMRDLGGRGALTPWLAGTAPLLVFGCLGIWALGRLRT